MPACRLLVSSILKLSLLAAGASALAQGEPGQWVGDLYSYYHSPKAPVASKVLVLVDEGGDVEKAIENVIRAEDFPIDRRFLGMTSSLSPTWHSGALYELAFSSTAVQDREGTISRPYVFAKWQDDEWSFLGIYYAGVREMLKAIPCDNDRFIVISGGSDLTGSTQQDRSPFVLMSAPAGESKQMRIGSSIYHGQDGLQQYMSTGECFKLAWFSSIVMTDSHAILINRNTGLYWVFSKEKANLVRAGSIFSKVTPEVLAAGGFSGFNGAILCANPDKDGTVLIAAQDEGYFMSETGDAWEELRELQRINPGMTVAETNKFLSERRTELAQRNPYIVWYRIYPDNGRVEKLASPPLGGSLSRDDGSNDLWRPMPDGSVRPMSFDDNWGKIAAQIEYKNREYEPFYGPNNPPPLPGANTAAK